MFFKDFVSVKREKIKRGASQTYDTPSNKDRNMADITEKTGNGELVTNRDQLVVVDNIESLIKVIRGQ